MMNKVSTNCGISTFLYESEYFINYRIQIKKILKSTIKYLARLDCCNNLFSKIIVRKNRLLNALFTLLNKCAGLIKRGI